MRFLPLLLASFRVDLLALLSLETCVQLLPS
jgi:hypothetical protein